MVKEMLGAPYDESLWRCRMISKTISVVLVLILLHGGVVSETQQQPPTQNIAKMQEVLHKAQNKDKAVKITLLKKINKQRKFTGKVMEISDAGFSIADQKTGKTTNFAYQDVHQVGQTGVSKGTIIAVAALTAGGLIILGLIYHELGKD